MARTAAARQVGEVWTRSAQNTAGYWNKPADTATAFPTDGWFRTGDAGYLDDEGYLFLNDRIKDMIVSGGENVYPTEVENVLAGHPAVAESAVIGVPSERWGETVKAVVVRAPGATVTAEELIGTAGPAWPTTSARPRSTSSTPSPATRSGSCSSASCARPSGSGASGRSAEVAEANAPRRGEQWSKSSRRRATLGTPTARRGRRT